MRIGKLVITQALTPTKEHIFALSEFVNTSVVVLEKIAAQDKDGTFVVIIGLNTLFTDLDDTAKIIPTYELEFYKSLIQADGAMLYCRIKETA